MDENAGLPELEDRLQHFQTLMPHRVDRILLVASAYDSFILGEHGEADPFLLSEYAELSLKQVPGLVRVSSGAEALARIGEEHFDLVISTLHLGDMRVSRLARRVKQAHPDLPFVLLAFDDHELAEVLRSDRTSDLDQIFVWHGDFRILLSIVKLVEDRWNVEEDVAQAGVSVILLIEDNVTTYSSFLPMLYTEVMVQSERVIAEGVNLTHKIMRMRARPKILLCTTYEEALASYERYKDVLLGVISDVDFPRGGKSDPNAGLDFARMARSDNADLPILLQSRDPSYLRLAEEAKVGIMLKDSPVLLRDLRAFMLTNFGFGDFVFRTKDGTEVGRAANLRAMEEVLREKIPDESLHFHASRNHFSRWLRARTEFRLAEALRRRSVGEFESVGRIRQYLIETIREWRRERQLGVVAPFERQTFDPDASFAKIGTGSLGGKARGLAFARQLIYNHHMRHSFPGVRITVPPAVVLATDVFDRFLDENDLRVFALREEDDAAIEAAFLRARFPRKALEMLYRYLDQARYPLAVRSSSLMEDSQHRPFAGIYRTILVPNNRPTLSERRRDAVRAIKRIYASTYSARAKAYFKITAYRHEEEKMAVVLQRLGGALHGSRFYPEVSGVARSHNFYPLEPMRPEDGVASVALGLGKTVVEGERAFRFCPRYPERLLDAATPRGLPEIAQTEFYALDMALREGDEEPIVKTGLSAAREDGTLDAVASVLSPENDAVYDGLAREGVPFVSMAPLLKHRLFPLADVVRLFLEFGERGLNLPIEIEFAVSLTPRPGGRKEFYLLQIRPMVISGEAEHVRIGDPHPGTVLCASDRVLGHGRITTIRDLVVVDRDEMDRGETREIAREVGKMNARLAERGDPYILIGAGRWGSSEPWLGIPVTWEQIAAARVIVEAGVRDVKIVPSQGSHFFHNLTSSRVGYFTVDSGGADVVDWEWLRAQEVESRAGCVRHIRLKDPVTVIMDSRERRGVVLKPGASENGEGSR